MFSHIWCNKRNANDDGCPAMRRIDGVVPLFWREHCLECSMPLCYKTCDIYKRRMDGRCIRFEHGIAPVEGGGAEIEFRRWAKLQSEFAGWEVLPVDKCRRIAAMHRAVERLVRGFCDFTGNYRLCQIEASLAERLNTRLARRRRGERADGFLAVVKNCEESERRLLFEIVKKGNTVYKTALELKPGWNNIFIPIGQMSIPSGDGGSMRAYLDGDQTGRFIFKWFDFVKLVGTDEPKPAKKVKCVAWDLDNTLWEGVIGEIGADGVKMKADSVALIKALDERGVVQTIASKNTREIAWPKLEEVGLAEYFLYPAINWGRKSENLKEVAKSLNINIDTFALIDDSAFERNEVKSALPQVRVYDVAEVPRLLEKDEFDMPVTEASRRRRLSYKEEEKRREIKASWSGDYDSFLRSCGLTMSISVPNAEADMKRCLELINRSNQYNISGKRYNEAELKEFLSRPDVGHYAFRVKDNYGDYGIVGYATIVKSDEFWRLLDFVMSCRVAQKKIERAFVKWLVGKLPHREMLVVEIKKTARNKPLQDEFRGMPFNVEQEDANSIAMRFLADGKIDDNVIRVEAI